MRSYYLDNENPYAGKMAPDGNAVIAGTMDPWTLLSGLLCDSYLYRDWGGFCRDQTLTWVIFMI